MNYFKISRFGIQSLMAFGFIGCSAPMEETDTTLPPTAAVLAVTTTSVQELPTTLGVYVTHDDHPERSTRNQLFASLNGQQYESTLPFSEGQGADDVSIIGYGPYVSAQLEGDSLLVDPAANQQTEENYRNANLVWGQQAGTDWSKTALPLQHKMSKLMLEVQYPAGVNDASDEYVIEQMCLSGFYTSASFFPLQGTFGQYRNVQRDILPFENGRGNYRAFIIPQQPDAATHVRFIIRQKSTGRTVEQFSYLNFAQTQHNVVSGQAYKVTLKVNDDLASSLQTRATQQIVSEVKICDWASGEVISLPTDQGDWLNSSGDRYGGQGTQKQPYLLRTAKDLADFAKYVNGGNSFRSRYICLDNDIDCTSTSFTPIGTTSEKPFCGYFNGNRHLISGIRYEQKAGTGIVVAGLFGWCNGATLERVTVDGSFDVEATICYVGGIVACATETTVDGCENRAKLTVKTNVTTGVAACVGGIVGDAAASVSGSINRGEMKVDSQVGKSYVAGIQGRQLPGTVLIACINGGKVIATGTQVVASGLTAQALGNVVSSYSLGTVLGGATSAALLSSDETTTGSFSYCFFDTQSTSLPAHRIPNATALNPKAVYGMTAAQLQNQFTIDDLNQGLFDWNKKVEADHKCLWLFTPTVEKWPGVRK